MTRRTQIALTGMALLALGALSSLKKGAPSKKAPGNGGACCPLPQSLDQISLADGTNGKRVSIGTNSHPAADQR